MLGLLSALDGCPYEAVEPPAREDLIDGLLDEVDDALGLLVATMGAVMPRWPTHPTAEEVVLCLCGEPPDRRGDWACLTAHLRVAMLGGQGMAVGRC